LVETIFKKEVAVDEGAIEGVGEVNLAAAIPLEPVGAEIEKIEKFFDVAGKAELPFGLFVGEKLRFKREEGKMDGKRKVEVSEVSKIAFEPQQIFVKFPFKMALS
jgi:hypothetical protein